MNRSAKLLVIGLSAIVVLIGVALLSPSTPVASGELMLPDGTTVRIVAVTQGTNHECGSMLARLVRHLPQRGQQLATALFGSRNLAWAGYQEYSPSTVVWLERITNSIASTNPPSRIIAWLSDESGFSSGNANVLVSRGQPFTFMAFNAVPRRSREVWLNFYGTFPNGSTNLGSLRFMNSLHGDFPQWEPEDLPSVKRAGDVEVTLTALATGLGSWHRMRETPHGGSELVLDTKRQEGRNCSVCVAQARSLADTNQVWRIKNVVLSDITGNRLAARMNSDPYENEGWYEFEHALWPDEHAWQVDVEVIRVNGLAPDELLTFRSVPLGDFDTVNELGWSSNVHGGNVTLKSFLRKRPDGTNEFTKVGQSAAELMFNFQTNVHLNFVGARLNTGETNLMRLSHWSSRDRTDHLSNVPLNASSVDITYSVQTSRWIRFLVKPVVGKTRLDIPNAYR